MRTRRIASAGLLIGLACGSAEERSAAPAGVTPPASQAPAARAEGPAAPAGPDTADSDGTVGTERCAGCHAEETAAWRGSHHDRAMQVASAESVLGDFADARFEHFGAVTTFSRRGDAFVVRTEGPDGALADYEVAYTFGVEPLQQLLIAFPGGRFQALGIAWDSRPREAGGQRWFHLHPGERVPPEDVLHWTKPAQNWNSQCAECHSTNLRKGYDAQRGTFATTWSELNVACEACHGPGAAHVAWAEKAAAGAPRADDAAGLDVRLRRPQPGDFAFAPDAPIAQRTAPRTEHAELETCAPCHSRRSALREGGRPGEPLLDRYRPLLLDAGLYDAIGQIHEEVYEYGSFLQSRMAAAGVTCSDCHDPHSLARRASGNALCAQCHRTEVFDAPSHHHHEPGSAGAQCVACHMPARTYMVVDVRHDHSFRVPRPDLSEALGTSDACRDCHSDRPARFAAEAVARWFPDGRSGTPHYAQALDAGRRGAPGAAQALAALARDDAQPAIARSAALALLVPSDAASADALRAGLAAPDPLLRLGALEAVAGLDPPARLVAAPLLRDPLRAIRIAAAQALAEVPPPLWRPADRSALADALAEYRAAQAVHAERPEAHVNLGVLHASFGEFDEARREYETALRLGPWFVPAYVNLADLERVAGRDDAAEALLRRALEIAPDVAPTHYALALTLVRLGRHADALPELERAAALAPDAERYALARALLLRELGDRAGAARAAREMLARWPDDPDARALLAELEAAP